MIHYFKVENNKIRITHATIIMITFTSLTSVAIISRFNFRRSYRNSTSSLCAISILNLTKSSCFTFRFQKRQNISFTDGTFDVSDELSILFVQELYFDLCTLSLRPRSAENLHYSRTNYGFLHAAPILISHCAIARRIALVQRVAILAMLR